VRVILHSLDDVTLEWVDDVLTTAGVLNENELRTITVTPIGHGQVADCANVELGLDDASSAPTSIVVKSPSRDETSRATAQAQRLYEREVRCYQHLLPQSTMSVARCFAADIDENTGDFALVLEDVAPCADIDQLAGFTPEHAEVAVDELAALHGAFWNDEQLFAMPYVGGVAEMMRPIYKDLVPLLVEQFIATLGDQLSPAAESVVTWLQPRISEFFERPDGPITLQHGDYRTDNMLFDACGGRRPLVVVDFQTISVGSPLLDLGYLLGTSLEPEDRRLEEAALLERYADGLRRAGVSDLDDAWLQQSYRHYAFQGVAMLTAASMLVERTERGDAMFLTMIERSSTMVDDLDARSTFT
jgi:Ecdysteroid kinase-like family